jgi:hypothetical protein
MKAAQPGCHLACRGGFPLVVRLLLPVGVAHGRVLRACAEIGTVKESARPVAPR